MADAQLDATRLFYQKKPNEYAASTAARPLTAVLRSFLKDLPDGLVLDMGCGGGHDLKQIGDAGKQGMGLDYAWQMAAVAAKTSGMPVVAGDIRFPPFPDEAFSGIWASASLLHLPREDILKALHESLRMLRPNGLFFASVKAGSGNRVDEVGRFFTLYEHEEWRGLLETAGFRFIVIESTIHRNEHPADALPERWLSSMAAK